MTIIDTNNLKDNIGKTKIFLGTYSGFQRFDAYQYKFAKQIEAKMRNAFWNPEEISLISDRLKFPDLPEHAQEILTQNLLFQTLMDSGQARGLDNILCPMTTSPEWEAVFRTQAYFEHIHSLTYSHIIREVYPNATKVFDSIKDYPEIQHRIDSEVDAYDRLAPNQEDGYIEDDKKRERILELLVKVFALEGVKFYVSFLTTYMINNSYGNKIQGITRLIKLINFDEDMHVSVFGGLLNILRKEQKEGFVDLMKSPHYMTMVQDTFSDVAKSEINWGKYLLQIGNIPGLTPKVLSNFVNYYVADRMGKLKIETKSVIADDTVQWFETYKDIDLDNVAGQESEGLAYQVGIIKNDVPEGKFKL